jgi:DNA adenine methylase
MIRSPFFYVGDKYKLMNQLVEFMPSSISTYVDVFTGGGSAFLNVPAKRYLVNDLDTQLINLHRKIASHAEQPDQLLEELFKIIERYQLSCSVSGLTVPEELRLQYPKTYFAHFNKSAYKRLREDFNSTKSEYLKLYLLLIYGFNRMLRFNQSGDFNLPVGNVDFNKNVVQALADYLKFMDENEVVFSSKDYAEFIRQLSLGPNDFVYLDPPYLISYSEYNKLWNAERERELYELLDELDARGVRFGLSNMLEHKGQTNKTLQDWASGYNVHQISSNYISFNDNTIKNGSRELYVTNHE